jgi:hypothetical protein
MGFDITRDEAKFINFDTLKLFFEEFMNSSQEEQIRTLTKI